jgi:hypothetical protein
MSFRGHLRRLNLVINDQVECVVFNACYSTTQHSLYRVGMK